MPSIKISKTALPDPPETLTIEGSDGQLIGTLRFTYKNGITSVLEYAPGQEPHRTYPLRSKHRQR
jgi:trehalose utilization protein